MSRKPWVVTKAVLAPVRSNKVLIATVVPCKNKFACSNPEPDLRTPWLMPSIKWAGVVKHLPKRMPPLDSSKMAISVNVPPTSAAIRAVAAELKSKTPSIQES